MRRRVMRPPLAGWALLATCSVLLLASCGLASPTIDAILKHPAEYDGKTFTLSGEVKPGATPAPNKYYLLDDGTGTIPVICAGVLPIPGARMKVLGRVNSRFVMASGTAVVVMEERQTAPPKKFRKPPRTPRT